MPLFRVTNCLENLEISGNLTAVRDFTKSLGVSEKKIREKWPRTVYLYPFLTLLSLCISFWFRIMHCCMPTSTTDSNTSTDQLDMIST